MTRVVDLRKNSKKEDLNPVIEKAPLIEKEVRKAKEKAPIPTSPANSLPEMTKRIEWEAPSFYDNRQKKYLALVVIVLLSGAGAMIFYHMDTLTAIFLILSSLVLILHANKRPTTSKMTINQASLIIDDDVYYFKDLKSFWIDYSLHGPKELSIEAKKWYLPYVKIPIGSQDPTKIRSLIINFVAEKEHEKSLADLISKKIGL